MFYKISNYLLNCIIKLKCKYLFGFHIVKTKQNFLHILHLIVLFDFIYGQAKKSYLEWIKGFKKRFRHNTPFFVQVKTISNLAVMIYQKFSLGTHIKSIDTTPP